jgi:hypothetical protein
MLTYLGFVLLHITNGDQLIEKMNKICGNEVPFE